MLATYEAGIGQQFVINEAGALIAGHEYRLTAFSLVYALSDGVLQASGDADFDVTLAMPEPDRELSLAAGITLLLGLAAHRARRSRR